MGLIEFLKGLRKPKVEVISEDKTSKIDSEQFKSITDKLDSIKQDTTVLQNKEFQDFLSKVAVILKELTPAGNEPKHIEPIRVEFEKKLTKMETLIVPNRILALLQEGTKSFKELKEAIPSTDPTTSKYLRLLIEQGKIVKEDLGRQSMYKIKSAFPIVREEEVSS